MNNGWRASSRMLETWLVVCVVLAVFATGLGAGSQRVRILDGDTLQPENGPILRLAGINAPEIPHRDRPGEPSGYAAKRYLASLVEGNTVHWDKLGVDRHGRCVAVVRLGNGLNLNRAMVEAGWAYRLPTRETEAMGSDLVAAQKRAMTARLGIWKGLRWNAAGPFWGNRKSGRFHAFHCPMASRIRKGRKQRFDNAAAAFGAGYAPARDCLTGDDLFHPSEK